jgi:hypothetical protein
MSTDVSEVRALIALMMEAARSCETSVDIQLKHGCISQKILGFIFPLVKRMKIQSIIGKISVLF